MLGIPLIPWQRWLLIHALELRPDGRFRFRNVLILVARQNGKTTLVEIKNLWKMFVLRVPLVIGTAQDLDTAEESWDKAVEIVESIPELDAEKAHVDKTNGKKALKLTNGSRWKIVSTSRRGGRGKSGDDVNLDELREHLDWLAWGAVTKTTMARANAQVWSFSNAGDERSVVLNELQAQGRATVDQPGLDTSLGLFEWSAPDDVKCTCGRPNDKHLGDCRLQDREAWAQANPSLGHTITEAALVSALETDPETIFRTECLCQRVPDLRGVWQVIREPDWRARRDEHSMIEGGLALAIAMTPNRSLTAIAALGRRPDGDRHVEVIDHRAGSGWVVGRVKELKDRHLVCAVAVGAFGHEASLIVELEEAGVEVFKMSATQAAAAFGAFYDGVVPQSVSEPVPDPDEAADVPQDRTPIWHIGQDSLSTALAGAMTRDLSGGKTWDWRQEDVDLSPLRAATNAVYAFAATAGNQIVLDGPLGV